MVIGSQSNNTLEIRDLVVEYRTRERVVHAVNSLSLTVGRGQTLGLVGETGAGKTTTGLAVMGLIPKPAGVVLGGAILLNGEDVLHKSDREMKQIRGKTVSMIFQDPMSSLNPVMSIERQISEAIRAHDRSLTRSQVLQKAHEMLEMVGIPRDRGSEYPHQFSGGMKQRVVIAMALSCKPDLIIADEPTTALDVTIQAQVLGLMKDLKDQYRTSMVMITHDLGIVAETCDSVSVMYAGSIVEHGTLHDVFDDPLHPYTKGLFGSLPRLDDRRAKLQPIKGLMPDPSNLPTGCTFWPRCDHAKDVCRVEKPNPTYFGGEHFVNCHLFNEEISGARTVNMGD
ncbi:MAG TPA: ABC transporter ATP-binding protein [Firmicutes bacterium]|nr:ABC transporter ATP-binding protein [Candidatus Fermentithermobacillaceae bacterium]